MSKQNIEHFIKFLLSNKNLDRFQKREVSKLLARDSMVIQNANNEEVIIPEENPLNETHEIVTKRNDVKAIFDFLHLFGEKNALKYTTHAWEHSSDNGDYEFADYDDFRAKYTKILEEKEREINLKGNTELWMLVRNFLLNDDAKFRWGEHDICIGHDKYVAQWMKNNPGQQPFSMPLSEFPEDLRPGIINQKSLYSFNDVVELFKHSIEFRDNKLYSAVKKIFKNKSFNIDKDKLSSLQGITFYTHTQKVKNVFTIIADNIFSRTDYPELEISCTTKESVKRNSIRIEILQKASYSNRSITDPKITGANKDGAIASILSELHNLCDFSVESKFKVNDKLQCLHIDYLISDKAKEKAFYEIPESECPGFKYILTFYSFNK